MAYDETLAERVRDILVAEDGLAERKMFGGLCFTLRGNMVCGIVGNTLMLRLNEELADAALDRPHVRPMDFTGRPMRTMVYVDPPGLRGRALGRWVAQARNFAQTLPPKN